MAKNSNKGFSLIEIIIAIAILTLLLTPIVKQYSQTLQVTRIAKEQQEQNETAVYQLEKFQRASMDDLKTEYASGYDPHPNQDCKLWVLNEETNTVEELKTTKVNESSGLDELENVSVKYDVYEYKINDASNPVKLGTRGVEYTNTVYLDNLSNKIRETTVQKREGSDLENNYYKVAYDNNTALPGFTLTNEGALVKRNTEGRISDVVVKKSVYQQDPNSVNLGNVQNMDKSQVAMVLGGTTSFDEQARADLFSLAMMRLKELDEASWKQAMNTQTGNSIFKLNTDYVELGVDGQQRCIVVKCHKGTNFYLVRVDVYYKYPIKLNKAEADPIIINYNVFTQRFDTDKCPDIFFEYQPYALLDGEDSEVTYAKDDFIIIDNGIDTVNGVQVDPVDNVKLFLYKPVMDARSSSLKGTHTEAAFLSAYYEKLEGTGSTEADRVLNSYYTSDPYAVGTVDGKVSITLDDSESDLVNIHIGATKTTKDGITVDPKTSKRLTGTSNRTYIYTNMYLGTETADSHTGTSYAQFDVGGFTEFKDLGDGTKIYGLGDDDGRYVITPQPSAGKSNVIQKVENDNSMRDRLYTVTVMLKPVDESVNGANTITLTGAKGEG